MARATPSRRRAAIRQPMLITPRLQTQLTTHHARARKPSPGSHALSTSPSRAPCTQRCWEQPAHQAWDAPQSTHHDRTRVLDHSGAGIGSHWLAAPATSSTHPCDRSTLEKWKGGRGHGGRGRRDTPQGVTPPPSPGGIGRPPTKHPQRLAPAKAV